MTPHKLLMIGTGGMARHWIHSVWATFKDRAEIVGLADVNADLLNTAGGALGLPASARFTSMQEAFAKVDAEFCCIVTPPRFHRAAVELAAARGMHILSEKPIADTWEDCCAIAKAVKTSGVKMMVTQNYRYTPRILTLKKAVQSLGPVNYAICRYAADYRKPLAWGAAFRHEMAHSLLVEASVHHFDQLRNLSGSVCNFISGREWNPGHERAYAGSESFKGESCGLYVLHMSGGVMGTYEGNNLATGKPNSWHSEYYRVECEGGVAVLDRDDVVRVESRSGNGTLNVQEMPRENPTHAGHHAIGEQFLDWLDGGTTPATVLSDNIQSNAMLFGAMQASASNSVVDVQALLQYDQ